MFRHSNPFPGPIGALIAFSLLMATVPAWAGREAPSGEPPASTAKQQVSVSFVTVRKRNGMNGKPEYFGGERGEPHAGNCIMRYEPIWGMDLLANALPFHVPEDRILLEKVGEMDPADFWNDIDRSIARNGDNIVLYIHGYNIGFEKSCRRASVFQRNLDLRHRMLLFSWPANGNVINYTLDEADLAWSVFHIERLLKDLIERFGAGRIDIVGHSLGARGIINAIARLDPHGPKPVINELVLIAPDIDTEIFGQLLPEILPQARRITLYASDNDHALRLSQEVHGYPRLGQGGSLLKVYPGVETIDVSDLGQRVASGHIYHLYNPIVAADIARLLNQGAPADGRPNLEADTKDGRNTGA